MLTRELSHPTEHERWQLRTNAHWEDAVKLYPDLEAFTSSELAMSTFFYGQGLKNWIHAMTAANTLHKHGFVVALESRD